MQPSDGISNPEVRELFLEDHSLTDLAGAADALSSRAMIEETLQMVRDRFDSIAAGLHSQVLFGMMAERVKVTEAVHRTGVPGTAIFLAIRHGEITTDQDDRGYDWVDTDEVGSLPVAR